MKTIEERLLDLERRFYPIENVLYNIMKDEIEKEKEKPNCLPQKVVKVIRVR